MLGLLLTRVAQEHCCHLGLIFGFCIVHGCIFAAVRWVGCLWVAIARAANTHICMPMHSPNEYPLRVATTTTYDHKTIKCQCCHMLGTSVSLIYVNYAQLLSLDANPNAHMVSVLTFSAEAPTKNNKINVEAQLN